MAFSATSLSVASANKKYAGIVVDAKNGKTLYSYKADSLRYPASLTKMMTLYMLFEQMEKGNVSKRTRIRISRHAASMQPSKLGIRVGGSLSAEQAIYALVTKSANDVAAAIGEHIGGTESKFAVLMTRKARSIGMSRTTFKNASGLPNSKQVTTARDMATLGIAMREHYPKYFRYFKTRSFKYGKRVYGNHNRLLGKVRGVDGIKTGYTRASGFNLVSSVYDRKRSIVGVVMGGKSGRSRNQQMTKLIGKYIGKATTGRDRIVVAKGRPSNAFASVFKRPKNAPTPQKRPTMVTAYASAGSLGGFGGNLETITLPTSLIPVPTASPIAHRDPIVTASIQSRVATSHSTKQLTVQTEKPASGWQIQIGAVPSKAAAIDLLEGARKYSPRTLRSVSNYTMSVDKNGTKLYRARFAGFVSKKSAWAACKNLKKKYGCLALAN
ncbi:MAG: D-alanyl-D-alanine carboxypeptidase [Hyphomicrobiales bacterium]|nr:D-alanyl-D-alanine carboxypeptidase [Hyphomicrobiales bacterium]PCH49665.1 MAG: D-alanyl-D-alanine carboxypeptidase [Hyphomicrobiales bacterium]